MKILFSIMNIWRTGGGYILIYLMPNKKIILDELNYWIERKKINFVGARILKFTYLVTRYKEYRNLLLYRFKSNGVMSYIMGCIVMICLPRMESLNIYADTIGKNFFIEHGIGTIISAQSIGDNCWINQQVTVGYNLDNKAPVIKNGVRICAGAKVLGGIVVEDNVIIGANAVVTKNVENNNIMAGVPAKKIGLNTNHIL